MEMIESHQTKINKEVLIKENDQPSWTRFITTLWGRGLKFDS